MPSLPENYKHHPDYRRCIHFRGIQNQCGAGIDPKTVRDASKKGPYRWPCMTLPGFEPAATECGSYRPMTQEELDDETAKMLAAVEKFEADLKSGVCPHCGNPILERRRSGRCEYAEPCGHRLGQVGGDEP